MRAAKAESRIQDKNKNLEKIDFDDERVHFEIEV